ncbi:xylanase deacetylase [Clostridium novyi B str. ATCC 27606]|uniref:Xylanase deacetylase n=2 Tax=Clostridium TaxID=1485 RepID=A0AA40M1X1_CLONO|nr:MULTISPECIES: polysaccharide deacetylase family protein [Clostridium]KEI11929.1 xylanase deacetylase [Clostridium novyi B str. NCTC 9691]KEI13469.1 xylanase deacetylase [Clostridium novyi B str. ATCC 27606]KEI17927.1 xylanase deacetylase [Clostridium haemolyticum NCTC 9693]KGN01560.1 xylanase deacetylase [Clostridium haemolyticum NCTC 8350]OOB75273.1 xylanase deacetylase [Clostridium haemolyticum]
MKKIIIIVLFIVTLSLIRVGAKEILLRKPQSLNNINEMTLKSNDESIPVIMYHSIKYEKGNGVRLPKEKFEEQMKYLKEHNYSTLTMDELYDFLKNNKKIPKKAVVLTFDDGYKDNYDTAYPILKKYGFKATLFVITNCIGTGEYLTVDQLKEMDKNGFDVESHTTNHEKLTEFSYEDQYKIFLESKQNLERLLNKKVKYIAYPYGKYDNQSIKAAEDVGYKLAVTTHCKWSNKKEGIYTISRVGISGKHHTDKFIKKIEFENYCRVYKYLLL